MFSWVGKTIFSWFNDQFGTFRGHRISQEHSGTFKKGGKLQLAGMSQWLSIDL